MNNLAKIFWFRDTVDPSFFLLERINLFQSYFEEVAIIQYADYCFIPIPFECLNDADERWLKEHNIFLDKASIKSQFDICIQTANRFNKPKLVLYYWDPETKLDFDNKTIVIRASIFKSDYNDEFASICIMPALHLDERNPISEDNLYSSINPIKWDTIPKIGFRGAIADLTTIDNVKLFLNNIVKRQLLKIWWPESYILRRSVLDILVAVDEFQIDYKSPKFENNSLIYQKEFINCLNMNAYCLCVRGHGNFSFRFNETMAAGRIPIFINTDCALPFENEIPYRDLCVWIELDSLSSMPQIILEFHQKNKDRFIEIQKEIKDYWKKYLSKEGFLNSLQQKLMNEKCKWDLSN